MARMLKVVIGWIDRERTSTPLGPRPCWQLYWAKLLLNQYAWTKVKPPSTVTWSSHYFVNWKFHFQERVGWKLEKRVFLFWTMAKKIAHALSNVPTALDANYCTAVLQLETPTKKYLQWKRVSTYVHLLASCARVLYSSTLELIIVKVRYYENFVGVLSTSSRVLDSAT